MPRAAAGGAGDVAQPDCDSPTGNDSVSPRRPAPPAMVADAGRALSAWARARSLGASSLCGISIALMLCAAVWLTAGTRADNFRAVFALWAGYVVFAAGRSLVARPGARMASAAVPAHGTGPARTGWLMALGWCLCECAVYAGLAVGAAANHWPGTWTLAIAVLSLTGVRELMTASLGPPGWENSGHGLVRRAVEAFVRMPGGGRVLLIGFIAPIWGGRTVLLALLDWSIIAVGFGLASQPVGLALASQPGRGRDAPERPPQPASPSAPASLAVLLRPAFADADGAVKSTEPPAGESQDPDRAPARQEPVQESSEPGQAAGPQQRDWLLLLRDDGALARWLGGLVRGSLLPLPPAVLGLAAVAVLTILGLQSLPSVLFLTPALVMLLAASGSSNSHAGRLDWLVPAVLLGAQFLYFAAIGQAKGVPGPATFALCSAVLLRYADLAYPGRPVIFARPIRRTWAIELSQTDRERGSALGWEGRMLLMGAAAAAGVGTFAFIAMTAYLGMLICAKVLTSSRFREGSSP